jgi:hypothetical protein
VNAAAVFLDGLEILPGIAGGGARRQFRMPGAPVRERCHHLRAQTRWVSEPAPQIAAEQLLERLKLLLIPLNLSTDAVVLTDGLVLLQYEAVVFFQLSRP